MLYQLYYNIEPNRIVNITLFMPPLRATLISPFITVYDKCGLDFAHHILLLKDILSVSHRNLFFIEFFSRIFAYYFLIFKLASSNRNVNFFVFLKNSSEL